MNKKRQLPQAHTSFALYAPELTNLLIRKFGYSTPLINLLRQEGEHSNLQSEALVIDVDTLAKKGGRSNTPSTVDMLFGCTGNLIQLVECKYRVGGKKRDRKSLTPPTRCELENKVLGTKSLLAGKDLGASFAPILVILFANNHREQARAWGNDYNAGKKSPLYKEMTTSEFFDFFSL